MEIEFLNPIFNIMLPKFVFIFLDRSQLYAHIQQQEITKGVSADFFSMKVLQVKRQTTTTKNNRNRIPLAYVTGFS